MNFVVLILFSKALNFSTGSNCNPSGFLSFLSQWRRVNFRLLHPLHCTKMPAQKLDKDNGLEQCVEGIISRNVFMKRIRKIE